MSINYSRIIMTVCKVLRLGEMNTRSFTTVQDDGQICQVDSAFPSIIDACHSSNESLCNTPKTVKSVSESRDTRNETILIEKLCTVSNFKIGITHLSAMKVMTEAASLVFFLGCSIAHFLSKIDTSCYENESPLSDAVDLNGFTTL
ncbi:hypothetical protein P5673_016226 [Acropora cervicornis]|uniref:Uncharacterized protein n=1 Tax=Acropora cervicornis TaxID=6130 RepID=A0AAD9QGU3_ACRCE|nr:hypothetical protein P5673_016226 [Acropora cervicornis]